MNYWQTTGIFELEVLDTDVLFAGVLIVDVLASDVLFADVLCADVLFAGVIFAGVLFAGVLFVDVSSGLGVFYWEVFCNAMITPHDRTFFIGKLLENGYQTTLFKRLDSSTL